ncbi:MAG: hypothetical protein HQK65_12845 [Desulfamplus sp.]|nr:hypothetical protein [Desulfamplus sp.]
MKRIITKRVTSFLTTLVMTIAFSNAFALDAPVLTVTTSGLDLSLSWSPITEATGYNLYYASYPYSGRHSIEKLT